VSDLMEKFTFLGEVVHQAFEIRTQARDRALAQARQLTRYAAHAIRAIHRNERKQAEEHLQQAHRLVETLQQELQPYPELYFAGYTQDAIKEYCEARITAAIILDHPLPLPEELNVEVPTYVNGLAEVPGELRRRVLDILRQGYSEEAERLLGAMDEIYALLVTLDYPDAVTNGLRRQTDLVRGIVERTRGDLTLSLREEKLKQALQEVVNRLPSES
jgi:translin